MVTVYSVNDLPVLTVPGNQTINEDSATGSLTITFSDVETSIWADDCITVSSSNEALVPQSNLVLTGSGASRTLVITPLAHANGSAKITVSVKDSDGGITTKTFFVFVSRVNDAPEITAPTVIPAVLEDNESGEMVFTVSDIDNNAAELRVTATSSNTTLLPVENIVLGGSGGNRYIKVTPAKNQHGSSTIRLTVDDGSITSFVDFEITVNNVNDAPEIGVIGNQRILQGTATAAIPFKVWDIDGDTLDLSYSTQQADLITKVEFGGSGNDRTIQVTTAADKAGDATITVTVSDGALTASESFTLRVISAGGSGIISDILDQEILEDTDTGLLYFTVQSDYANDVTAVSSDQNLVPDGNITIGTNGDSSHRTIKVTPVADKNGRVTITVTAEKSDTESATEVFEVNVIPVNDEPVINGNQYLSVVEDHTIPANDSITVTDVDNDQLTITLTSSNQVLIPDANVQFESGGSTILPITPVANRNGTAIITVKANDGHAQVVRYFQVTVIPDNDTPTISTIGPQTINEDQASGLIEFTVDDEEMAAGSLSVSATSSDQNIVADGNLVVAGTGSSRTLKITPNANKNTPDTPIVITVTVSDGGKSADGTFNLTVTPVNDAPGISSIADLNIEEDTRTTIPFTVWDIDGDTVTVTASTNRADIIAGVELKDSGNSKTITLTPALNASGTAVITLEASDNQASATRKFSVTVVAVNDPPIISELTEVKIDEDAVSDIIRYTVEDAETPADNLTVEVTSGNQTLLPNAIIVKTRTGKDHTLVLKPEANQNGSTTITVKASDGEKTTIKKFDFIVKPVNDLPTITMADEITVLEDKAEQTVVDFTMYDLEKDSGSLVVSAVSGNTALVPANAFFFGGSGAKRTIKLKALPDKNGQAKISISAFDGEDTAVKEFFFNVTPVNDVPSFTKGADQVVNEDAGPQSVADWAKSLKKGPEDESGQGLEFIVTNDKNGLFTAQGQPAIDAAGTLTYTPADNASGVATVTVKLQDDGGTANNGVDTSQPQTFKITIKTINDVPSFSKGSDQIVMEDAPLQTVNGWATAIQNGGADEAGQVLTFEVTTNNDSLFSTKPAIDKSGTLTYRPAANVFGQATVTVKLSDGGAKSEAQTFIITVTPVNDAPSFTKGANITVDEDAGPKTYTNWATAISKGANEESSQTVTFYVSNDNSGLFSAGPELSPTGTLTFTPADQASGIATVTVILQDNGGTDNGGVNKSPGVTFTIIVNPINDPPTISEITDKTIDEDTLLGEIPFTVADVDNAPETLQVNYTKGAASNMPAAITLRGSGSDRTIEVTQPANQHGQVVLTVTVSDGSLSASEDFTVFVTPQNDAPTASGGSYQTYAGVTVTDSVYGNDIDGDVLTYTLHTPAEQIKGNFQIDPNTGAWSYTSQPGFSGQQKVQVRVADPSGASALAEVIFDIIPLTLELKANPGKIKGNGKDETKLTATVKDRNGVPIPNIEVTFAAEKGTFYNGNKATTDGDGVAQLPYRSEKMEGTESKVITVTATVNEPQRSLYAQERIYVTFEPSYVTGTVIDNATGKPIQGAKVEVSKHFNDGTIRDFYAKQITGDDGKYEIAVPRDGVEYEITITKPVQVGNTVQEVTFTQKAEVTGDLTEDKKYPSNRTATGIIVSKKTDGSESLMQDVSQLNLEIVDPATGQPLVGQQSTITNQGVFTAENLTANVEYTFRIKYQLAPNQELIVGEAKVKLTENGELNISEILIDPYGTVTDKNTGAIIVGAKVQLYFADTARNRAKGNTPGDRVNLPAVSKFPPADNANPQDTDNNGKYAFMVFPESDYYVEAEKAGYKKYVSLVIPVEFAIVQHDFVMEKAPSSGGGPSSMLPVVEKPVEPATKGDFVIRYTSDRPRYTEGDIIQYTIAYKNFSDNVLKQASIAVTVADYAQATGLGGGLLKDNIITWQLGDVPAGGSGELHYQIVVKEGSLASAETTITELATSYSGNVQIAGVEAKASLSILLFTNDFGEGYHRKYIAGYPDQTFRPQRNVTRAEVAAMLVRITGGEVKTEAGEFPDVSSSHWAYGHINTAQEQKLMGGYADGTFRPDQPITRAELSVVIARFMKLSERRPIQQHFGDVSQHWAVNAIEELHGLHVVNGYAGNLFKPDEKISRAETVTMINHLLNRGALQGVTPLFPDVKEGHWAFGQVEEASRDHHYLRNADGSERFTK